MNEKEAHAALEHFLDLDNPYLGEDQRAIMRGVEALKYYRATIERLRVAKDDAEDSLRACIAQGEWLPAKFYFDRTALTGKEQE